MEGESDQRAALVGMTALGEVLDLINRSAGDPVPIFAAILDWAHRLCGADVGQLMRYDGRLFHNLAIHGFDERFAALVRDPFPPTLRQQALLDGAPLVHIQDVQAERAENRDAIGRNIAALAGIRTFLMIPLRKDGKILGTISAHRTQVRPFSDQEIALLQSFAAQTVIAMENARLITEQREALERQTATAEVLGVINAHPGDLRPVFEAMLDRAMALCDAAFGELHLFSGELFTPEVLRGVPPALEAYQREHGTRGGAGTTTHRMIAGEDVIHIHDAKEEDAYRRGDPARRARVELGGVRSQVSIALRKDGTLLGMIRMFRQVVKPFDERQIALLQNFAAQAVIAMENARLINEQREALEQQTATSEVLGVINASPGNLAPVFATVLEKSLRLCESAFGFLRTYDGEYFHTVATLNVDPAYTEMLTHPVRAEPGTVRERVVRGEDVVHIADLTALSADQPGNPDLARFAKAGGARTALWVALRKDGALRGMFNIFRREVRPFTEKQIALVRDFATQAVIAMENARLITEQREALEQQTATAEVLGVINASPGNLAPVFDALLERAMRLCGAKFGSLYTFDGTRYQSAAQRGVPAAYAAFRAARPPDGTARAEATRTRESKRTVHILDMSQEQSYLDGHPGIRAMVDLGGARTVLAVPLLKDDMYIGYVSIYRQEVRPFADKEIALLENFAAQAVIAMENARLLRELREQTEALARRNSEFGEQIEQQSATIDVLKVMSASPGDPQPVFYLIAARARTFAQADSVAVTTLRDGELDLRAHHGTITGATDNYRAYFPRPADATTAMGRAVLMRAPVMVEDVMNDPQFAMKSVDVAVSLRSLAAVPMLRGGEPIGSIVMARTQPGLFSDTQLDLLQTFAEQAVIAITSAETYRELQERTEALALRNTEYGERIEQQSATIDVLKVMSASPGDPQPVFDLIAERARVFCHAYSAALMQVRGGQLHLCALTGHPAHNADAFKALFPRPVDDSTLAGRAVLTGHMMEIPDVYADDHFILRSASRDSGLRALMAVPMLRGAEAIGGITIGRTSVGSFSPTQIELLRTFAEQAVIAISSAENHRALQARTDELTRSVSELQALEGTIRAVNSSLDLDTVLETIIARAVELSQADEGTIYEYDEAQGVFIPKAAHGMSAERVEALRQRRVRLGETHLGRSATERRPIHVSDIQQDRRPARDVAEFLEGIHAVLAVPLLRDDKVIGGLVIRRRTAGDFGSSIPTLLQTFAGQSVLAIENARLFEQLAARGEEARRARVAAEAALEDLRKAQDRLVQTEKMASLGQLTAGIAHEIKNPLNFVNNFSDLSTELLDELNAAIAPLEAAADPKLREEIADLTEMLKGNLAKIAEHGRRADSIVKNMLAHSRTGGSERRSVDVNTIAEEALNLAYHGARAEFPGFNITLERELDPAAGEVELYPQEFTRVLLNLISNGFYATRKRAEQAQPEYEPTLQLGTRAEGDQVEITVRDNGTGIPETVREKIFEPFFTTKPAGEGTGLGLSLSYDIIVKQHGGQLTVESEPGSFTEFRIILPRRLPAAPADIGRTP